MRQVHIHYLRPTLLSVFSRCLVCPNRSHCPLATRDCKRSIQPCIALCYRVAPDVQGRDVGRVSSLETEIR